MNGSSPTFSGLRVAALESRRKDDMERLILRYGGQAFVAPSMREVPIEENREAIDFAYRVITGEINIAIFMTGVGFRQFIAATERHVGRDRIINALTDITTVVRGPKPLAAMRDLGIQPTFRVPEPNTWRELLQTLDQSVPLLNQRVGLQEYGTSNHSLIAGLEARGATVDRVRVYQYDFPTDCQPLEATVKALAMGERDVILLTSAHQVVNLLRRAESMGLEAQVRQALDRIVVGSIGPTTSEMLQQCNLPVDFEPEHPKMGHLVQAAAERSGSILEGKRQRDTVRLIPSDSNDETRPAYYDSAFLKACRREPTPFTPVWLMRQAGRYMAEYREVRANYTFLELCKNPKVCAEVMVTAVDKLGVDAAIIFSDLLPILEPMGMNLEFAKGDGPVIHNPIRTGEDLKRVKELESMESLDFVMETVSQTRAALSDNLPLIGFAGAPFTLASYMIEGGSSRSYLHTKTLMYNEPAAWADLMQILARTIARYLNAQIAAGAQCVQIFDSWAGCLAVGDYQTYVAPYMRQIIDSIHPDAPVINFATGNPALLPLLRGDRRTVVGVDWRIPLDTAWQNIGTDRAVQGNMDPTVLLGSKELIRQQVKQVLEHANARPGHIFNLGHGILQQTPVENAQYLVEIVHELSQR